MPPALTFMVCMSDSLPSVMSLLHSWEGVWRKQRMLGHPGLYNLICPVWVLEVCISAWSMARSGFLLETLSVGLKPCPPPSQGFLSNGKVF